MKKIIISLVLIILLLPAVYSAQQKVYILNLKNDNGKIIKESLIVTQGFFVEDKNQPENGYRLELVSFTDKVLYTKKFNFPKLQKGPLPKDSDILERAKYLPDITEKEPSTLKTSQIELIMPYYGNAKLIRIYDQNNINVLEIDVSSFAEKVAVEEKPIFNWLYALIFLAAIATITFFVWLVKQKSKLQKHR